MVQTQTWAVGRVTRCRGGAGAVEADARRCVNGARLDDGAKRTVEPRLLLPLAAGVGTLACGESATARIAPRAERRTGGAGTGASA